MPLDDEVRPARTGFLLLALFAATVVYALLASARMPGSALSYSGGTTVQPYSMLSTWAPTLAAGSDEFTADTSASWTLQAAGGTGTTTISPFTAPSVSLFNFATYKTGWLYMQAESGTGAALASKAYTLPTNIAAYSRILAGKRAQAAVTSGIADDDGRVGIVFGATSAGAVDLSNYVECAVQKTKAGTGARAMTLTKVQAGVLSEATADPANTNPYNDFSVVLLQKRSTTYHCWICRTMAGTCGWIGATTWGGAATLDRTGFLVQNNATTTPGPLVMAADFFRIVEADNVLP